MQSNPAELTKVYRLHIQNASYVTNFSSLFPEHPSWLKLCHVGMSFINFWSGTQLVRNGWVLVCRMLLLSWSLLMRWCTFSKPFIFRRLWKYQPHESLQGSAMQVVSRHQVCSSLPMYGENAETGWPYHLLKKTPNHGVNCQPPSPRQLKQCPSNIQFPSGFIRFVCGSCYWHWKGFDLQPMGWGWYEVRWLLYGCLGLGHWIWAWLVSALLFRKLPPATWTTLGFCLVIFSNV